MEALFDWFMWFCIVAVFGPPTYYAFRRVPS